MKLHSSMTALLLGGAAAAASGYAEAQQGLMPLSDPAGTEIITVYPLAPGGGAGGAQAGVTLNQIRNASGYTLFSSNTSAASTITLSTASSRLLIPVQPATLTVTLPGQPAAFDGELIAICNVTGTAYATNTTNIVAGSSSTISNGSSTAASVTFTTLASHTCLTFSFDATNSLWYEAD